jgi:DNA-directed RNA polymerase specialized sigma24 family protein
MLDFYTLYEMYAPQVYRFAYWLAGDGAEADDITSETSSMPGPIVVRSEPRP